MTTEQRSTRQVRAIRKALELRWYEHVIGDPRYGWYVDSHTDPRIVYSVSPDYRCDCAAGALGQPCLHAASCYVAVAQRAAFRPYVADAPRPRQEGQQPAPAAEEVSDATRRAEAPYSRPSGRGVGISEDASLEEDGDVTQADVLAALGWRAAA